MSGKFFCTVVFYNFLKLHFIYKIFFAFHAKLKQKHDVSICKHYQVSPLPQFGSVCIGLWLGNNFVYKKKLEK